MQQYAKLISETEVQFYSVPSNITIACNTEEEKADIIKELAENAGFKKYNPSTPVNVYYKATYRETAKNVYQEWVAMDLAYAKEQQKALVKQSCNNARAEAFSIYSEAEQVAAQDNSSITIAVMAQVRGVTEEQQQADIDAALQMGTVINGALAGYFLKLEDTIKAASDVDAVAIIEWSREEFTVIVEALLA